MGRKKSDRNARKALNEFKYEMSEELAANKSSNNYNTNTNKKRKSKNKQMGNSMTDDF
ncbi:small, acid-soluble spore protein, alpha/beta type [Maledivibacter halophilus]|uniref:Small, acid-soluble spore protein, alpha/beta type n=1 Tax=Maledivibacter halophilus TaxID=36842 RepID=A0A1T5IS10_9FIRM|nr:small, acid-soluble spore protein, alpha/beta type [Maledivibacter halophilus]SKC41895.1 Small, acid-soluble spore protein, alpha/beta type [Maledivibacter halophilus]